MGSNDSFGGISVLLIGDLHQLPPVKDRPIYHPSNISPLSMLSGAALWEQFKYFQLTEIMRQKEDKQFIIALNNLSLGEMTASDIALIKCREVEEEMVPTNTIRLYHENKMVDDYNDKKIRNFPGVHYEAKADHHFSGNISMQARRKVLKSLGKSTTNKECKILPLKILLKLGITYMVTSNINVIDGLVNGACGVRKYIEFKENEMMPSVVWFDFNNPNVGIKQRQPYIEYMQKHHISLKLVPISRITMTISIRNQINYQVMRTQFPIVPAEAMTIHKSQGQTYHKVCIDLRSKSNYRSLTKSLLYVAFSRVC